MLYICHFELFFSLHNNVFFLVGKMQFFMLFILLNTVLYL